MIRILALIASVCLLALSVWAQSDRGVITGTVVDQAGAVVPGARVTVTNVSTRSAFSTSTTATGNFTVPSIPPGTYEVRIEQEGFKVLTLTNLIVAAGATVSANAQLEIGAVSESVQVSSSVAQLQTETAKTATAVNQRMVDELPLVVGGAMRGAFDLAVVTPQANNTERPGDGDKAFNVGGGQAGGPHAGERGLRVGGGACPQGGQDRSRPSDG